MREKRKKEIKIQVGTEKNYKLEFWKGNEMGKVIFEEGLILNKTGLIFISLKKLRY